MEFVCEHKGCVFLSCCGFCLFCCSERFQWRKTRFSVQTPSKILIDRVAKNPSFASFFTRRYSGTTAYTKIPRRRPRDFFETTPLAALKGEPESEARVTRVRGTGGLSYRRPLDPYLRPPRLSRRVCASWTWINLALQPAPVCPDKFSAIAAVYVVAQRFHWRHMHSLHCVATIYVVYLAKRSPKTKCPFQDLKSNQGRERRRRRIGMHKLTVQPRNFHPVGIIFFLYPHQNFSGGSA